MQCKWFHARKQQNDIALRQLFWVILRINQKQRQWRDLKVQSDNKAAGRGHAGSIVPPLQRIHGSSGGSVRRGWRDKISCRTRIAHTRVSLVSKYLGIWLLVFWCFGNAMLTWCTAVHLPVWKKQTFLFQHAPKANVQHVASIISTLIPSVQKKERTL